MADTYDAHDFSVATESVRTPRARPDAVTLSLGADRIEWARSEGLNLSDLLRTLLDQRRGQGVPAMPVVRRPRRTISRADLRWDRRQPGPSTPAPRVTTTWTIQRIGPDWKPTVKLGRTALEDAPAMIAEAEAEGFTVRRPAYVLLVASRGGL